MLILQILQRKNFGSTLPIFMFSIEIQDNYYLGHLNNGLFPTLKELPVDENTPKRSAIVQYVFSRLHYIWLEVAEKYNLYSSNR